MGAPGGSFVVTVYALTVEVPKGHKKGSPLTITNPSTNKSLQVMVPKTVKPGKHFAVNDHVVSGIVLVLTVPEGSGPGQQMDVVHPSTGETMQVLVPDGVEPNQQFQITAPCTAP